MDDADRRLLVESLEDPRMVVEVVLDACLYSCCGKPWQDRIGYEQTYQGRIITLDLPDDSEPGCARLVARGIGTVTYTVIFGLAHLVDVRAV